MIMNKILSLIESYGISLTKVPNQELLEKADYEKCKNTMKYLHDTSLLKSKFIVNKLASILLFTTDKELAELEEVLNRHGLNAYEIMYKANSLLVFNNITKTEEIINEFKNEEYGLDYKKILTEYSSLIVSTSKEQIRSAMATLKRHGLDPRKVSSASADIFNKGSLNFTDQVITLIYDYYGIEEGKQLLYKSASILSKGNPDEIRGILSFFEGKIGKERTKAYFQKNSSLLARGHADQVINAYQTLEQLGIENIIFTSATILMRGSVEDIKKNYTWLKQQNPNIDIESTPVTLTYPHQTIVNNYQFYQSHNLDKYITDRASCLGRTRSTQELEDIYQFLLSIGIKDFEEYMSVLSTTNLHEIEEIYKLLIDELGKERASELIKTPSILLANYASLRESITFIREHDLFEELKDKPYVLSETYIDKMEKNFEYVSTLPFEGLTSNISIIARGEVNNMKNILNYLSSLGIEEIVTASPILLTRKYKNIKSCIDYFISIDRLDIIRSRPSVLLLRSEEVEKAHQDIKDLGLEELLDTNPNVLRGKNIKTNAATIKGTKFKSTAGIASAYSAASSKVNVRKEFFDAYNLQELYQKAPSILSEGKIEIIKESYLTLEEEGLTSILSRSPSIITRLKGKDAILSRLEHLYSLGLTKEDIKKLPSILVRYSDEEILRLQSVPRRNRK